MALKLSDLSGSAAFQGGKKNREKKDTVVKEKHSDFELGAAFLNRMPTTEYLPIDSIAMNPLNQMSMDEEELAQLEDSIRLTHSVDPLLVRPGDPAKGEAPYVLLSGHRRLTVIKRMLEKGTWTEKKVECKVQPLSSVPLPIAEEDKELMILRTRNQYRVKTDGDLFVEMRDWKKIIAALRAGGVEVLSLDKLEGEPERRVTIKGNPTKNIISEMIGASTGTTANLMKIDQRADESVVKALEENEISLWQASKLSELPAKEQEDRLKEIRTEKQKGVSSGSKAPTFGGSVTISPVDTEEMLEDLRLLEQVLEKAAGLKVSEKDFRKVFGLREKIEAAHQCLTAALEK